MSDVGKYLALRAAAATQPNGALAGFGLSGGAPAAPVVFDGDFGALFASYGGLTVHVCCRGDLGQSGSQGSGKAVWANQRGAGSNIVPAATGAANGIGTPGAGLAGKASLVGNGVTQCGTITLPTGPTPGTTNRHIVKVKRVLASPGTVQYMESTGGGATTSVIGGQGNPNANELIFNGAPGASTTGRVINTWYMCRYSWIGGLDQIRVGSNEPTPVSTSNSPLGTTMSFCGVDTAEAPHEHLLYMVIDGPLATLLPAYADACIKAQAFWSNAIEI
jgi:hypothetical protein